LDVFQQWLHHFPVVHHAFHRFSGKVFLGQVHWRLLGCAKLDGYRLLCLMDALWVMLVLLAVFGLVVGLMCLGDGMGILPIWFGYGGVIAAREGGIGTRALTGQR